MCLMSTGSLSDFPFNTRTHFVNLLPTPIRSEVAGRKLYVRLRAIAISCHRDEEMLDNPQMDYLKVNLSELEPKAVDRGHDQCAGGFEYPPRTELAQRTGYAYHTFTRSPYLRLRYEELTKLEVTIVDVKGNVVEGIYSGPPTLVLLDVSDTMMSGNFTMTCNSNQPQLYTNNTLSQFTSPLYQEMDMSQYQVALVNVLYPPTLVERTLASMVIDGTRFDYDLDEFTSTDEFLQYLTEDLKNSRFRDLLKWRRRLTRTGHDGQLGLLREKGRVNRNFSKRLLVSFSHTFTMACGQLHDFRAATVLTPGKVIAFKGRPNINLVKPNPVATLHCDIVQSGVMGNRISNLLACVPVMTDMTAGRSRLYEAPQLIYYDVKRTPFNSVSFNFTNPDGTARRFATSEDEVYDNIAVTLSFRAKPRSGQMPANG